MRMALYYEGSNYWCEEKLFDDSPIIYEKPQHEYIQQTDPTQNLLKEFELVFDSWNNGAFTPPQSPPLAVPTTQIQEQYQQQQSQPILISLEPITYQYYDERKLQQNTHQSDPKTPSSNIAHELAEVDELVKSRIEYLVPSSPCSSTSSRSYSNDGSTSDDAEWDASSCSASSSSSVSNQKSTRTKRSKPYNTTKGVDRKVRKKEQNKNAATRYRIKKKMEIKEILGEESVLKQTSVELNTNIADLQREIKCLKGLMRDMFKAKGLIN